MDMHQLIQDPKIDNGLLLHYAKFGSLHLKSIPQGLAFFVLHIVSIFAQQLHHSLILVHVVVVQACQMSY